MAGLRERDDTDRLYEALADPDKVTLVQVAPAVRTAWCEAFGLPREAVGPKKQLYLTRAAQGYLKVHGALSHAARFDVVEVYTRPLRIRHIPNAF